MPVSKFRFPKLSLSLPGFDTILRVLLRRKEDSYDKLKPIPIPVRDPLVRRHRGCPYNGR